MKAFEHVTITRRAEWRAWLAANHTRTESIWLVTFKKRCGERHVPYDDVVEEALCFGWIDSHIRRVDDERSKLLISPRRPRSPWSRLNKQRVERLSAAGLITPAGWAPIEAAKVDGSWTVYDEVEELIVPPDLAAALEAVPDATARWAAFSPSSRKGILWWIKSAKRAPTRDRRIAETARLAGLGLRANFPEAKGR